MDFRGAGGFVRVEGDLEPKVSTVYLGGSGSCVAE